MNVVVTPSTDANASKNEKSVEEEVEPGRTWTSKHPVQGFDIFSICLQYHLSDGSI